MTFEPCPETCDACSHYSCEQRVTYKPIPGIPLTPDCSDGGLIFTPNGKGGGKLHKPLRVNGKVRLVGGKATKSSLVAKVRPWA